MSMIANPPTKMSEESFKMQLHLGHGFPKIREEPSTIQTILNMNDRKPTFDHQSESALNQLVLYRPYTSDVNQDMSTVLNPCRDRTRSFQSSLASNTSSRVLPSVGQFTVQCATCLKWRFVPTKEKYEEIREHILQVPFVCDQAREWRPDISCAHPADIYQDDSRLWAIDKPSIAQPPPGWERLLRIRGEGSTRFADVYYSTPTGKKLRSMPDVEKYLFENPEYIRNGVNLSQFSFQIPKPIQENYVRKRGARPTNLYVGDTPDPLIPYEVNPLSWAAPPTHTELELGGPGLSTDYFVPPFPEQPPFADQLGLSTHYFVPPVTEQPPFTEQPPAKKRAVKRGPKTMSSVHDHQVIILE